jgi:putative ABC transport system permease protein
MLAIGEGASREAQDAIVQLGSTNLIIETVKPPEEKTDTGNRQVMKDDAESIRNTIPDVQVVVPIREIDQKARYLTRPEVAIKIIGTIPWYTEISPIRVIRGRFLSSVDLQYRLAVCVIDDHQIARKLFAFDDPLGLDVQIHGSYYRVVGIVSKARHREMTGAFGTIPATASQSGVVSNVYIPLTTARCRFPELDFRFSGGSRSAEKVELQKITVKVNSSEQKVNSSEQVLPLRDILDALLARLHNKQDYNIVVPLELLRQAARTRRIFSIVLGSIAAISLLVGGIGIMNIMLATVSERTRDTAVNVGWRCHRHYFRLTHTILGDVFWQYANSDYQCFLGAGLWY